MTDCKIDFNGFMAKHNIVINSPIVMDGKIHRVYVKGDKAGTKNGWYIYHSFPFPVFIFGSWKTGEKFLWKGKPDSILTQKERSLIHRQALESSQMVQKAKLKKQSEAKRKAKYIWSVASQDACGHPYLLDKNIMSYGLRLYKAALIVPVRDIYGDMHSLQFIDSDGQKRFLSGGRKAGCFSLIGNIEDTLCIAEGYATAASIHMNTGNPVAVAFDAGNLMDVSLNLRTCFPKTKIIVCADNDAGALQNTGLQKATEAANVINAEIAVPPCMGDFNDYYNQRSSLS